MEYKASAPMRFLYRNPFGRFILKTLTRPTVSKIGGAFLSSPLSKPMIKRFIKNNKIDMSQFETVKYKNYNDFFTRKIVKTARPIDMNANSLISPCDSRVTLYNIDENERFFIKGREYSIEQLLGKDDLAQKFSGGVCLVFRLQVDDYHRYSWFDSGEVVDNYKISGKLHTVQPIALERYNYYHENAREITVMNTRNFGVAVQCEIGALMVGKIVNHKCTNFEKGEEKGYFEFGGSTIALLLSKDVAKISAEIIENSKNGIETQVKLGEKIGEVKL